MALSPQTMRSVIVMGSNKDTLKQTKEFYSQIGTVGDDLDLVDGFQASIPAGALESIYKSLPNGVRVCADTVYKIPTPIELTQNEPAKKFEPAPDVLKTVLGLAPVWEQGLTGKGVGLAVVDTGIFPHPDLADRIVAFKDMIDGKSWAYDDQGHGTHVAGDAAGSGKLSGGKFKGPAYEADLIGVRVLNADGAGTMSDIIKGIQWVVRNKEKYNIRVMNLSLGGSAYQLAKNDPVVIALERAKEAGIVPVLAAGNEGPEKSTLASPGIAPGAITVGAYDDKNTIDTSDDGIAKFSSRGPTLRDRFSKPDLVTPGVLITAPVAYGSSLDHNPKVPHVTPDYIAISGTSMATPVTSGLVLLMVQANPNLKSEQYKDILKKSCHPLPGYDANTQGAGLPDIQKAVEMVRNVRN